MTLLKSALFSDSEGFTTESGVEEATVVVDTTNEEDVPPLEEDSVMGDIVITNTMYEIDCSIEENTNELKNVEETSILIEDLNETINGAEKEQSEKGEVSTETALMVIEKYNKLLDNQNIKNVERITTESGLKYKNESYELTVESAGKIIEKIKESLIKILRMVVDAIKKGAIKFITVMDNIEVVSKDFANHVSSNYTDIPISKYSIYLDKASVVGRVAAMKELSLVEFKKFLDFTNNGAPIKELTNLFIDCVQKQDDMHDFETLTSVPVAYDFSKYYDANEVHKVVPITVAGKTANVLISKIKSVDSKGVKTFSLTKADITIIPSSKLNSSTPVLLSRKDIIETAKYITLKTREKRESVKNSLAYLDKIRATTNNIKDGANVSNNITRLTSLMVNAIYANAASGLLSNRLVLGLLSDHAKLYTKQIKIKN